MALTTSVSLLVLIVVGAQAIDWQPDNWAFACDFFDNDIGNAQVRGEDCGRLCNSSPGA